MQRYSILITIGLLLMCGAAFGQSVSTKTVDEIAACL